MKNAFTGQTGQKRSDARPAGTEGTAAYLWVREDSQGAENAANGLFQRPARDQKRLIIIYLLGSFQEKYGVYLSPFPHALN